MMLSFTKLRALTSYDQAVLNRQLLQKKVETGGTLTLMLILSLVNQQLSFDCSNLHVNHAKAVQLTAASEGDVLYMISKYFWLG